MNKYEVIDIVGEGAYGVVLKCKNKETQDFVAIKKFKESEDDEAVRRTTIRELKVLRQLKHDNIVNLIEAFRRRGKLYLVFEYVSCNMLELLDGHPHGVASKMVMSLTYQLLKALHWCHSHSVIHRDIKPENLLISEKNELKLCDFGFARALSQNKGAGARYTEYVATRWYRSPELLVGVPYGPGVDIWSAACIMGELAEGRAVFPGESDIDQLYTIQKKLGPLPENLRRAFFVNPRYRGVKFPDDMPNASSLALSFKKCKNMSKAGLELLAQMLEMSPSDRPTSVACLAHRAFSGFRVVEAVAKLPDSGAIATSQMSSSSSSAAGVAAAVAAVKAVAHPSGSTQSSHDGRMSTRRKSAKRRQERSPHTDESDGGGGNRGGSGTGSRGHRQQPLLTQTLPVARGTTSDDLARGGLGSNSNSNSNSNSGGGGGGGGNSSSSSKDRTRPFLIAPTQASLRAASTSSTGLSSESHHSRGLSSESHHSSSEGSSGWRTRSKRRVQPTPSTSSPSQNRSNSAGRASTSTSTSTTSSNTTSTSTSTTSTSTSTSTSNTTTITPPAHSRSMKSMELPQKPLRGAYGAGPAASSISQDSWLKSARHPPVSIGPTHSSQHPPRALSSAYKSTKALAPTKTNSPKIKGRERSLSRKPTYGSWEPPKRHGGKAKGLPQLRGMSGGADGGRQKSWSGVTTL